jgi:hypothetical protein
VLNHNGIAMSVSDPQELRSLLTWLALVPGVQANRVSGRPGVGEQGALDIVSIIADSGALIAAIRVLPEFLRAKRAAISVNMTVKGRDFTLTASNVDDVLPILERLIDA